MKRGRQGGIERQRQRQRKRKNKKNYAFQIFKGETHDNPLEIYSLKFKFRPLKPISSFIIISGILPTKALLRTKKKKRKTNFCLSRTSRRVLSDGRWIEKRGNIFWRTNRAIFTKKSIEEKGWLIQLSIIINSLFPFNGHFNYISLGFQCN